MFARVSSLEVVDCGCLDVFVAARAIGGDVMLVGLPVDLKKNEVSDVRNFLEKKRNRVPPARRFSRPAAEAACCSAHEVNGMIPYATDHA